MNTTPFIAIGIAILLFLVGLELRKKSQLRSLYGIIWRKSTLIQPVNILRNRPFHSYYYFRNEDERIRSCISNRKNVLVYGQPLSGKTRAIYEALINLEKEKLDIIVPNCDDINLDSFLIPTHNRFWRTRVLLIDDLHRLIEKRNFDYLLMKFIENNIQIIATCRSGFEYKKTNTKLQEMNIDMKTIFGRNVIELRRLSNSEAKKIAKEANISWSKIKFDGTVGSIFLPLGEMKKRFDDFGTKNKQILRTIKELYISGIYEGNNLFPVEWIKQAAKKRGLEGADFEWSDWFRKIEEKEFIYLKSGNVDIEEAYLTDVIPFDTDKPQIDILKEMNEVFLDNPKALFKLGNRASLLGEIEINREELISISIKAFTDTLSYHTLDNFPVNYGVIHNNIGSAYLKLSRSINLINNCKKAIKHYSESLKVFKIKKYPLGYSIAKNNIGNAYNRLSRMLDPIKNLKKSIDIYKDALKPCSPSQLQMQYATIQNNLGLVYRLLSRMENTKDNIDLAIEAHKESLKIYTLSQFPINHAQTLDYIGCAYWSLSQTEGKTENCKKAIKFFEDALKYRTKENFQLDYAETKHNMATAYMTLAEIENQRQNSKNAIALFNDALEFRTLKYFPIQYAMTQNNLGVTYRLLAVVENTKDNCIKSITSLKEALRVRTKKRIPYEYAETKNNIAVTYGMMAQIDNTVMNCEKAIESLNEAISIWQPETFPRDYAFAKSNLGIVYCILSSKKGKKRNCKNAINSFNESLKISSEMKYSDIYQSTKRNLERAIALCKNEI